MARQVVKGIDVPSRAPRARWFGPAIAFGLVAAPAAWLIEVTLGYGLASYSCFPADSPRSSVAPGFEWVWGILLAVNVIALGIAAAAAWVSLRNLWKARFRPSAPHAIALSDVGMDRNGFLSIFGFWSGVWFLVAIALNTITLLWVPLC